MIEPTEADKQLFEKLESQWHKETDIFSGGFKRDENQNLLDIIAMGEVAAILIFEQFSNGIFRWFSALKKITNANPVPYEHRGYLDQMCKDWIIWAKENGFL